MSQEDADWRPRLSIEISPEQAEALQRWIPWGMRKMVFTVLIDLLIAAFEKGGAEVLISVVRRELDIPGVFVKEK